MTELRQDITTGEWVVLTPNRADRPRDIAPEVAAVESHSAGCPFCPSNEALTPQEVATLALPEGSVEWQVRIVPNLYPSYVPDFFEDAQLSLMEDGSSNDPLFPKKSADGFHEVVIETRHHSQVLTERTKQEAEMLMLAYHLRHREMLSHPGVRAVHVIKNHGSLSGATMVHPHSQMYGTGHLPQALQNRINVARRYFETHQRSLYADMVQREKEIDQRVVLAGEGVTLLTPFAARWPYELWLVPHDGMPSLAQAPEATIAEAGRMLQEALRLLREVAGDCAYNYVIHSADRQVAGHGFQWHIQVLPRVKKLAAYELGSGMVVNEVAPEETAWLFRQAIRGNGAK